MELPADYAVLSDDEMTYTSRRQRCWRHRHHRGRGRSGIQLCLGHLAGRDWLSVDSNRRGNPLTVMGRAMDAIGNDMSKSPSNFLRDVVSTGTVVALAPLSALLLIL